MYVCATPKRSDESRLQRDGPVVSAKPLGATSNPVKTSGLNNASTCSTEGEKSERKKCMFGVFEVLLSRCVRETKINYS